MMPWWNKYPGLRESVLDWLESIRSKTEPWGRYKYCAGMVRPWGLESSCCAVKILSLLGALQDVAESARRELGTFIISLQDPETGMTVDPLVRSEDKVSDHFPWEHIWGHATGVALQTLPLLGMQLPHIVLTPDEPQGAADVAPWLEALPWTTNPWRCGSLIGQYLGRYRAKFGLYDTDREDDMVAAFMDWLEAHQDPRTGLWGTDRCAETQKSMAGLHCMSTGTYYLPCRPLRIPERIIDSVLALQQPDGDFSHGGGCLNYDAVKDLSSASRYTEHRRTEIIASVDLLVERIFNTYKQPDGAFSFAAESRRRTHGSIFIAPPALESEVNGTFMYLVVLRERVALEGHLAELPPVF